MQLQAVLKLDKYLFIKIMTMLYERARTPPFSMAAMKANQLVCCPSSPQSLSYKGFYPSHDFHSIYMAK